MPPPEKITEAFGCPNSWSHVGSKEHDDDPPKVPYYNWPWTRLPPILRQLTGQISETGSVLVTHMPPFFQLILKILEIVPQNLEIVTQNLKIVLIIFMYWEQSLALSGWPRVSRNHAHETGPKQIHLHVWVSFPWTGVVNFICRLSSRDGRGDRWSSVARWDASST